MFEELKFYLHCIQKETFEHQFPGKHRGLELKQAGAFELRFWNKEIFQNVAAHRPPCSESTHSLMAPSEIRDTSFPLMQRFVKRSLR